MYIVYDIENNIEQLRSKYLVLELDTIEFSNQTVTSYAVIDKDSITFDEIPALEAKMRIHEGLIRNYHQQNWDYCEEAMGKLAGSFKGTVDSFYEHMEERIATLKTVDLPDSWTGNVVSAETVENK